MSSTEALTLLYEDNHLAVVNKPSGAIVQGDKTGDQPLSERLKAYIKERDRKPGAVFLGTVHRLDRPTSGIVVFAKTSKGLARMNWLFASRAIEKTYWAVTERLPDPPSGQLVQWLKKNEQQNKSYVVAAGEGKRAVANYRLLAQSDRYYLLEVQPQTGRHHQIRAQLSSVGAVIKGDVKYGAKRPNKDGSIHLLARKIAFVHPVKKQLLSITAPVPEEPLWKYFEEMESRCRRI